MTKSEMENEIISLHKALKECILTDSQISLLEFQDQPDIDWGYHDQYDF